MSYYIGPEGPLDASLAIVAEKPGRDELTGLLQYGGTGRPLIGVTGRALDQHLLRIGTHRSKVYLTNAVKTFDHLGTPSDTDIKREQLSLFRELHALPNLNCVVAMGRAALLSLSNFHYDEMTSRRGSIMQSWTGLKMIPTFHPSFYMHGEWRYKPVVEFDLARAYRESQTHALVRQERTFHMEPAYIEAMDWLYQLSRHKGPIAFDIETFRPHFISCIGFATSATEAWNIPIMRGNRQSYWDRMQEVEIWRGIQTVFDNPDAYFLAQNGLFDAWHLWRHGIRVDRVGEHGFDTMYAHRLIAADLPHALEFLCSIYTEEPYYKDESGSWKSEVRVPDRQFWGYNCKDACVTSEVYPAEREDMKELGLLDHYEQEMHPQWPVLLSLRQRGIRVNVTRLTEVRATLNQEIGELESKIKDRIGWIPNTKSSLDMGRLLSGHGVSPYRTKTGKAKIDSDSLLAYADKSPGLQDVLFNCLSITERRTLRDGFLNMGLDSQGFYHPSYDLSHAVSGRLSSSGADEGGPQLQNIPLSLRSVFIPDTDQQVFSAYDLEQAEGHVYAWLAEDIALINAFESGLDVHKIRGCSIYRGWASVAIPPSDLIDSILRVCQTCLENGKTECVHSERYLSKRCGLAFTYRMGIRKLIKLLRAEGVFMSEREGRRIQGCIVTKPMTEWHTYVYSQLKKSAWLTTPLGRRREFYGILDDDMLRKALSWLCQATVSQVTNRAMVRLHQYLPKGARIVTQTHDSLLLCHYPDQKERVDALVKKAFDTQIPIHNRTLTIPFDNKSGPSWGELRKYELAG